MPVKSNLKSRTSTISNAFTISITPYIVPTPKEIAQLLCDLDIKDGQCAYCLRPANSTDHFRPLVKNGLPNGYISDINNLVPCCADCNSSKGKKDWDEWYNSEKNLLRLKGYGLSDADITHRFEVLQAFDFKTKADRIDYEKVLGKEKWEDFISNKKALNQRLIDEQKFCDELRKIIEGKIDK